MQTEILSHDTETYMAEIRFTHNGVTVQDKYNLLLVEPSMKRALETLDSAFTPEMQQTAITKLAGWIQDSIEAGGIKNIDT
jgi:hypothetical protein